jgi:uncharacterized membrane protein YjgN (DUF898 family)
MVVLGIFAFTADWIAAKWLLWIVLYLILGMVLPWALTRAWAHQHRSTIQPSLKQLFQHGELGLVGLMLAISVIWDLQKSQYTPETVALGSVFLAMTGIMAGSVWVESYCRRGTGTRFTLERAWRDSRSLAFLVFSMAIVTEILIDRFAKVAAQ